MKKAMEVGDACGTDMDSLVMGDLVGREMVKRWVDRGVIVFALGRVLIKGIMGLVVFVLVLDLDWVLCNKRGPFGLCYDKDQLCNFPKHEGLKLIILQSSHKDQ